MQKKASNTTIRIVIPSIDLNEKFYTYRHLHKNQLLPQRAPV